MKKHAYRNVLGVVAVVFATVVFIASIIDEPNIKQVGVEQPVVKQVVEAVAMPIEADAMPVKPMFENKHQFIGYMLPLIIAENAKIEEEYHRILEGSDITDLMKKYKTDDLDELKKRVQPIPVSLTMAQAGVESAWGSSRFAKEGNNFFGMRTYDLTVKGMKPKRTTGFVVISYDSPQKSIASYMRNLNTHNAYKKFRTMRDQGATVQELIKSLTAYSETENVYVNLITRIIRTNNFSKYDS